ncbi:hypothetical protein GGS23DRAFT_589900 [Durotheca rogersii]|uniref:uncharacterized protein n=1 Tax=Durotheca rogersii TaxID=419775 RepID=UPI0022203E69|nr:uncharacterized protein GGS23DRAFT_589900 [Durotheca rogersii]KAI5855116.1 hypothetical protein GGS23DRAFT_589900 [Durotheca rogersii]
MGFEMALTALAESGLSRASVLAPLHVLSYSALLGAELYQTFIMTKVCYESLPRSAFTTVQKRLFPIYFRGQAAFLLLTAVTVPPHGPLTLQSGMDSWLPFAVAGVTALLNLLIYGPRTRQIMVDRIHQGLIYLLVKSRASANFEVVSFSNRDLERREGRKRGSPAQPTDDMMRLNREFYRNHAMSIHLNLISISAMIW